MANILAGFVSGAAKYGLDQINRNEEEDRDIRKMQILEQLRRDTEKEMAEFRDQLSRNKVDKSMSTDDYSSGKRTLRNEYGEDIGEVTLPTSAVQDYKDSKEEQGLDRQYKQAQIGNFAMDNARADEQLAISRGHLDLARKQAANSLDGGPTGNGVLSAEANQTFQRMKDSGAPDNWLAQMQAKWYDGVNNKKWTKEQQRVYLSQIMNSWANMSSKQSGLMAKIDAAGED